MNKASEARARFGALLSGPDCVFPASVQDAAAGRMADALGYEMAMLAGSVASLAVLGAPDLIVLTLTEFAEQARRITRAARLPLMVDADHGYGNALNVRRTVEELETAGIAALTIEDTSLPQGFGTGGKAGLIDLAEGVGKMRAALEARSDPGLAIIGRTGAAAITDLDDAIRRCQSYEAAGVDGVMLTGVKAPEAIKAARAALRGPLLLGVVGDGLDAATLGALGVSIALREHLPMRAAIAATYEALKAMREGGTPERLASAELMDLVSGAAEHARWRKDYLG